MTIENCQLQISDPFQTPPLEQRWRDLITGRTRGPGAALARATLWTLSGLYGALVRGYRMVYDLRLIRPEEVGCRVVSVGNLTVGGTGKTTTVRWLAGHLRDRGVPVAVLSYGYRAGSDEAVTIVSDGSRILVSEAVSGDEPRMLAEALPGVPVLIGKRRVLSAAEAVRRFGVRLCVLDDGFQYWRLKKDLDLVLIDALCPFGGGYVLPRGLLRESARQLRRAHALVITNSHRLREQDRTALREQLRHLNPTAVLAEARHVPSGLRDCSLRIGTGVRSNTETTEGHGGHGADRTARQEAALPRSPDSVPSGVGLPDLRATSEPVPIPQSAIRNQRVLALSSLGNPEGFEQTLADMGAVVIPARYPDHHHYRLHELQSELRRARDVGCTAIVTTEKDAVKLLDCGWRIADGGLAGKDRSAASGGFVPNLQSAIRHPQSPVPIWVLSVEMQFEAGQDELETLLGELLT